MLDWQEMGVWQEILGYVKWKFFSGIGPYITFQFIRTWKKLTRHICKATLISSAPLSHSQQSHSVSIPFKLTFVRSGKSKNACMGIKCLVDGVNFIKLFIVWQRNWLLRQGRERGTRIVQKIELSLTVKG